MELSRRGTESKTVTRMLLGNSKCGRWEDLNREGRN